MSLQVLSQVQTAIETFIDRLGRVIAWFTLLMVVITAVIVILRYGFNLGWIAMQESVIYLHATVFMLGAAYTLQKDEHVRVDIFYQKFSARNKAWVDLFGTLLCLMPVFIFLFVYSFDYVLSSWKLQEASAEAGGLPAVFLLKSLLLVMPALMLLQGLAMVIKQITILAQGAEK